jgi:hypothetical protein
VQPETNDLAGTVKARLADWVVDCVLKSKHDQVLFLLTYTRLAQLHHYVIQTPAVQYKHTCSWHSVTVHQDRFLLADKQRAFHSGLLPTLSDTGRKGVDYGIGCDGDNRPYTGKIAA